MRLKFLLVLLASLFAGSSYAAERTVIVALFDGFSPAEQDAAKDTPNLDRIKREGVWSRHLVPAFPSVSLINHTTFATGCWPEHHGMLSNYFYDPKRGLFGDRADVGGPNDPGDNDWHTGCETMWQAAERQGVRAAAFNFVGRWSMTKGKMATYANPPTKLHEGPPDEATLASGLKMLADNGPNHPRLIALYFKGPDETAHYNGVESPKTQAMVRKADWIVGQLMAGISKLPKDREAALIVGTDHGMIDVGPLVNVGRLMNMYDIHARQATDGATSFLYLDKGESADRVVAALAPYKDIFKVYRKGHYPAYAHLGDGPRAPDLLLVSHPPYWMVGPEVFPPWTDWIGIRKYWPPVFTPFIGSLKATHGYDPTTVIQMHGIFYAWGAGVAKGKEIKRLDMIDVHPTAMKLLGLQPGNPVDGHPVAELFAK